MGECRFDRVIEAMARLARIKLSEEERRAICSEMEALDGLLRRVSEADVGGLEPLYHVWEISAWSREKAEPDHVRLADFLPGEKVDEEGRIRVPWRGVK